MPVCFHHVGSYMLPMPSMPQALPSLLFLFDNLATPKFLRWQQAATGRCRCPKKKRETGSRFFGERERLQGQAARHFDDGAINVAGLIGSKKRKGGGNFFRFAQATHRHAVFH